MSDLNQLWYAVTWPLYSGAVATSYRCADCWSATQTATVLLGTTARGPIVAPDDAICAGCGKRPAAAEVKAERNA